MQLYFLRFFYRRCIVMLIFFPHILNMILVVNIYLDFSKGFDSVSQIVLLEKLAAQGLNGWTSLHKKLDV